MTKDLLGNDTGTVDTLLVYSGIATEDETCLPDLFIPRKKPVIYRVKGLALCFINRLCFLLFMWLLTAPIPMFDISNNFLHNLQQPLLSSFVYAAKQQTLILATKFHDRDIAWMLYQTLITHKLILTTY